MNPSDSASSLTNVASIIDIDTGSKIKAGYACLSISATNALRLRKAVPPLAAAALLERWDVNFYLRHFPSVSAAGRHYIGQSLEAPARNPSGTISNTTRFASRKTGQTVTAESDQTELPTVMMCERSDDVFFYVEQPGKLELTFDDGHRPIMTTPDFLIFFKDGPCICECKPEKMLARLVITQPHRYQVTAEGDYVSRPAERAAAALGLPFRVIYERHFSKTLLQNFEHLTPYYASELRTPVTKEEMAVLQEALSEAPGTFMTEIPIEPADRRADVICSLIARRSLFAHLEKVSLKDQARVRLYLHPLDETAFAIFHGRARTAAQVTGGVCRLLPVGSKFRFGKHSFTVLKHRGDAVDARRDSSGQEETIPYATLHASCPKFDAQSDSTLPIWDLIASLSKERLETFLRRLREVRPYLDGEKNLPDLRGARSIRRYVEAYRIEQASSGCGERALIPELRQRGNSTVCKESNDCLNDLIKEEFLSKTAPKARHIHRRYVKECERLGLPESEILVYKTVSRRVKTIREYEKALKCYGRPAALKFRVPRAFDTLLGSQNNLGPWARGHIDHTVLDLYAENPVTGKFERPCVSAMVDGYDRRILAFIIWFGNPNAKIVFDLHDECIGRHGILPRAITCDWGSDFRDKDFQKGLARVGISLRYRPKSEPRHGSPVETTFSGVNERWIHNAAGNTKAMKNPREIRGEFLPEKSACWGFDALKKTLGKYAEAHNNAPREHKLSPNEMCQAYLAKYGMHHAQWISTAVLENLRRLQVPHDTRKVSQKGTVRVNSADYASPELMDLVGHEVDVFCNDDPREVFVEDRSRGRQIPCACVTVGVGDTASAEDARKAIADRMNDSYGRLKAAEKLFTEFTDDFDRMQKQQIATRKAAEKEAPPKSPPTSHGSNILSEDEISKIWSNS